MRSSVPGGFSYGDYLRAGAIARLLAGDGVGDRVRAATAGLVLGICNGFQVLCEARLLPGALLMNANLRFTFRQLELEVLSSGGSFTRACRARRTTQHPGEALLGAYYADPDTARRDGPLGAAGAALRGRGRTSTARCTTSPGSATRPATCSA